MYLGPLTSRRPNLMCHFQGVDYPARRPVAVRLLLLPRFARSSKG